MAAEVLWARIDIAITDALPAGALACFVPPVGLPTAPTRGSNALPNENGETVTSEVNDRQMKRRVLFEILDNFLAMAKMMIGFKTGNCHPTKSPPGDACNEGDPTSRQAILPGASPWLRQTHTKLLTRHHEQQPESAALAQR